MRLRNLLPLVALLAVPAMAQERPIMGGFQVGLASPTGSSDLMNSKYSVKDLVDNKIGFNIGGHVSFDLQNGHMVRARLDETAFSGDFSDKIGVGDAKIATLGVMGDYLYHISGNTQGFYLTAGIGYEFTSAKINAFAGEHTSSKGAFAYDAGLGWQFTPMVGMELRYASSHPTDFDYVGGKYDVKNDRVNLSVAFSF